MKFKNYLGLGLIMLSGGFIINMFINDRTAWFVLDLIMVAASSTAGYILIKQK
jgi:hypothetical protein